MANRHDPFIREATRAALVTAGEEGLTWRELAGTIGTHHGVASGRLSLMHRDGEISRLFGVKRGGSKVYVSNAFVNGRPTEAYGRTPSQCPNCGVTI